MPQPPETRKPFYLTTPIYYVNARPHIGHAYTTIVADVLARRHRLLGDDTFFLTGTDEHGQKIERSAAAAGIPPQQFADQVSASFEALWQRMGITHNDYIRTTDPRHKRGAQKLFTTLYERGFIYLASYTGSYCVSDEAFIDAPVGTPCPDCGRLLEEVTEENFFFKLSAFQTQLIDLIESGALTITPEAARNEVLSFIRGGLKDLSISRSSFTWGIPVPEPAASHAKQPHVIYVWLDALANYMTALGYGSDDETLWEKFWPADLHLVGKEITRFHCVYWPAFLLAAGLPLPKQITANGWLLFDNAKMSKSKGNIVRTETILDAFGTLCPPNLFSFRSAAEESAAPADPTPADRDLFAADILRYYLLREIPFGQDGTFTFEALITRYNADLANGYGNLVSRTLNMIEKYFDGRLPIPSIHMDTQEGAARFELNATAMEITGDFKRVQEYLNPIFESYDFYDYLLDVMRFMSRIDSFISASAPWKLAKSDLEDDKQDLATVLFVAAQAIRLITALLYPILPYATAKVWKQLGFEKSIEQAADDGDLKDLQWGGLQPGTKLGPLAPIFPRAPKELAQIMTDMENPPTSHLNPSHLSPVQNPPSSELNSSSLTAVQTPATTAPDAPPRALDAPSNTLPVAGSQALTTGPDPTLPTGEPAPAPADTTPQIAIDDFAKIDLRVAQITLAERIPKADKLLRLEVDLGPLGTRQILSGIAEFYTPEELLGRRIVVIANLAPRKMRGLESHGMLLAASEGDHGKPHLATCGDDIALGARLK